MGINISNFLSSKSKNRKMIDFQDLDHLDGLSISTVSANLYKTIRDDLVMFYFREGANFASVYTQSKILSENSDGETDYLNKPSEDFARSLIEYLDEDGNKLIVETTTSWCFVGEGLRLSMELFGPEYSMFVNTLDPDLKVFFSRKVTGSEGEDLVEKQNAESGGMPVVSNEAEVYGYTAENRHMVESFLIGKRPEENFDDGLDVTRLLMAAYMSAEQSKTIKLPNKEIEKSH